MLFAFTVFEVTCGGFSSRPPLSLALVSFRLVWLDDVAATPDAVAGTVEAAFVAKPFAPVCRVVCASSVADVLLFACVSVTAVGLAAADLVLTVAVVCASIAESLLAVFELDAVVLSVGVRCDQSVDVDSDDSVLLALFLAGDLGNTIAC